MNCRLLNDTDFENLHKTFIAAFSDYRVKMNPTSDEFERRIRNKLNIDYSITAGSFDGENMMGFILHTTNVFQGIPTAYNGGTGVLPGFRNQRIAEQLYEFLIPKIQEKSLARILLEVIDENESAIRLYEKIGFTFKRRFLCYKQTRQLDERSISAVEEGNLSDVDFSFMDFHPSFLDSEEQLSLGSERVLLIKKGSDLAGYLIFQPDLGRISQLSIGRLFRNEGFGESLIFAAQKYSNKALTILNIPEDEVGFDAFLRGCGFENQVSQFEMELII